MGPPSSAVELDVQLAALLLQPISLQPDLGVTQRRAGPDMELPQVLETGQHRSVVDALLERHGLVGAQRLIREERVAGIDDEHVDPVDLELLHPVCRHVLRRAQALPTGGGWHGFLGLRLDLIGSLHARLIAQPLDRPAADDVRRHDLLEIRLLHAGVPDVFGIDHDHRAVSALVEAAGLVDPHVGLLARRPRAVPKHLHVPLHVGLRRAGIPAGTHEHVTIVLAHLTPLMGAPRWPPNPQPSGVPAKPCRPLNFHGGPEMAPKPDSLHGGLRAPPKLPQTFGSPGVAVRPSKFHGGPEMAPKPPNVPNAPAKPWRSSKHA